jgi:hypothetical protein
MALRGTGFNYAARKQQITAIEPNVIHGLRVTIQRGPVRVLCGSTEGGDEYFNEVLGTGAHSLAFTPTGNFWIECRGIENYTVLVDSIAIESSGIQTLPAPWAEADLGSIRWEQSEDVIFLDCREYQSRRVERRGPTSWSIVLYEPEDGPFRVINTSSITMTPSAISGDIQISASQNYFKAENVGSLIKIDSIGQLVSFTATGADQWSDSIRVTGVDNSRIFNISVDVDGSWSGTITVQRSVDEEGNWQDVSALSYTSDTTTTHDDGNDNQIIFYRIGVKTGNYSAGTAALQLSYGSGSNTGIARVTEYNNATSVSAIVLDPFGGTSGSSNWYESEWSDRRGFPDAPSIYEGRLVHAGKGKAIVSESDAYSDFDDRTEGDSGPINRNLGAALSDNVNWVFSGSRLVFGTDGGEITTRQAFDEFITPTNFGTKYSTRIGSANVPLAIVDNRAMFVQREGTQIYQLVYDSAAYDYQSQGMTELIPEIGEPSIIRLAAQRQPDTRIHAVRSDGKVALMVTDPAEDVSCWVLVETDGVIEDVIIMPGPGNGEDAVYYFIQRTIDGNTVRYLEKWALESQCQGGTLNRQADSFIVYQGASTTTLSGLDHLEGEDVIVWQDGICVLDENNVPETYTVSSGSITIGTACTNAVIGLPYTAKYKSNKLAYLAEGGTALLQKKRVNQVGFILSNTHKFGVRYGPDFSTLDDLPLSEGWSTVAENKIWETYDEDTFEFNGSYTTDSRVCFQSQAPLPCTLMALVISMQTNEKG